MSSRPSSSFIEYIKNKANLYYFELYHCKDKPKITGNGQNSAESRICNRVRNKNM